MNREIEFGLKELTDLTLKATYPIEVAARTFEPGEVIARFDKVQIANFQELVDRVSANGGYDNRSLVVWEDPKQIQITFTQGIFSPTQFALLSNSRMINMSAKEGIKVPKQFTGESDDQGVIRLGKEQVSDVFVYDGKTYEKILPKTIDSEKGEIVIDQKYCDVVVDFNYLYYGGAQNCQIGHKLIQGYLQLEGKSRVKDDITGKVRTALLRIPRLKLVSDLSMRLGRDAAPMVANFSAIGLPVGEKGDKKIMELLFLNDDVEADI